MGFNKYIKITIVGFFISSFANASCLKDFRSIISDVRKLRLKIKKVQIRDREFKATYISMAQRVALANILDNMSGKEQAILEIGYGHPSLLLGLKRQYPDLKVYGTEINEVHAKWGNEEVLSSLNLRHSRSVMVSNGNFKGKFDIIFGVDVFKGKEDYLYGSPFNGNNLSYLYHLKKALRSGGRIIIINDYNAPNGYSLDIVEKVGLKVISWNEQANTFMEAHDIELFRAFQKEQDLNDGVDLKGQAQYRMTILEKE